MNEADLVRRAQQGDDAAWTTLIRHHQQVIFRLAWLLVGDADDAEDVAQRALIRAFRRLDTFDLERPLRPWLLQITRNEASNWRRSVRRYLAALGRTLNMARDHTNTTDLAQPGQTEAELLQQAMRQLDRADQEIIYLRYFLDLPVAETADALAIAPGTVKSRTSRALTRLRAVVEAEYPLLREERVS